jgi:hypothetical protein
MTEVHKHKITVGKTCKPLERKRYRRGTNIYMCHIEILCKPMNKVDKCGSAKKSYKPSSHNRQRISGS